MNQHYFLDQKAELIIAKDSVTFVQGRSNFLFIIVLAALIPVGVACWYLVQQELPYLIAIPLLALVAVFLMATVSKRIVFDKQRGMVTTQWMFLIRHKVFSTTTPYEAQHISLQKQTETRKDNDGVHRVHVYYYLMNNEKTLCDVGSEINFQELSKLLILDGDQPVVVKK